MTGPDTGIDDPGRPGQARLPWHAAPVRDVLYRLVSSEEGLPEDEAVHRLELVGPNRLSVQKLDPSGGLLLLRQFTSLSAVLLLTAAVLSLVLGRPLQALIIGVVLLVSTAIRFGAQLRSRRFLEAALERAQLDAVVIRDGRPARVDASRLVPGDVIEVTAGQRVPADARLIDSTGLRVEQGALTGDETPVRKAAHPPSSETASLGSRTSMVFLGTRVLQGNARAVVTATGGSTAASRLGRFGADHDRRAESFEARAVRLGSPVGWIIVALAGVAAAAGVVRGLGPGGILETGIALSLASVHQAILAVPALFLALWIRRMAAQGVRVQHSGAVEALGTGTVVCAEMAGTLTTGTVQPTWAVTPSSRARVLGLEDGRRGRLRVAPATAAARAEIEVLLRAAALSLDGVSDRQPGQRDPLDPALRDLVRAGGLDPDDLVRAAPAFAVIPYDRAHRMSACFRRGETGSSAYIRGAPDAVLGRCVSAIGPLGTHRLDERTRARIEADARALSSEGYRVVALARHPTAVRTEDLGGGFAFIGLVGLDWSPTPGIAEAVSALEEAAVRPVLFTEETGAVGQSMARKAGVRIGDNQVVDVADPVETRSREFNRPPGSISLFGGLGTGDRYRIVKQLQVQGEVVLAVGGQGALSGQGPDLTIATGDDVTDPNASGADVVLEDRRFSAVPKVVSDGRAALATVRRSINYLRGCAFAEVLVLGIAPVLGWPLPLAPLQILWLNLATDVLPSAALAAEPRTSGRGIQPSRVAESGAVPRQDAFSAAGFALVMALATLGAFVVALSTHETRHAVTVAFTTLALAHLLHLGNARSGEGERWFGDARANPWLWRAVVGGFLLQLVAVYWSPLAGLLGTVPLGFTDWALALGFAVLATVVSRLAPAGALRSALERWGRRGRQEVRALEEVSPVPAPSILVFDGPPVPKTRVAMPESGRDDPWPRATAAVQSGDVHRLRELIRRYPKLVRARDGEGTLLHHATGMPTLSWCQRGPDMVSILVGAGADPNAGERLDGGGETPLIQAASLNNTPVALQLLESGADLERHGRYPDQGIDTALGYALLYGKDPWFGLERGECVELLLDWGALTSLPLKAALGRRDAVAEMLPLATPEDRQRAMVFAAHRGETAVVQACLEAGVDPSKVVSFFRERLTPLLAAAGQGHLDTVQALLDAGVEPEWPEDGEGTNAMVWAWTRSADGGDEPSALGRERSKLGSR